MEVSISRVFTWCNMEPMCHMLYFHQVQFPTSQYFNILCTSDLFLTQLHTCLNPLLLFKLRLSFYLSFYLFSVLPVNSVPFIFQPPPVLLFDHSLYLVYLFIILCLCMWISLACDFICALLHPPLPFPYHSLWYFLCLILLLSLSLWLLCMSLTPYIISYSPVLVLKFVN